jgi:putative transcriptional regulator
MTKRYRSGPLAAVHETATGLREAGAIDRRTKKVFDKMCLAAVKSPDRRQHGRICSRKTLQ